MLQFKKAWNIVACLGTYPELTSGQDQGDRTHGVTSIMEEGNGRLYYLELIGGLSLICLGYHSMHAGNMAATTNAHVVAKALTLSVPWSPYGTTLYLVLQYLAHKGFIGIWISLGNCISEMLTVTKSVF